MDCKQIRVATRICFFLTRNAECGMIKKIIWQCRRGVDIKAAKQGRWEPVGDVEGALKAGAGSSVNVYGSEMKRVADQRGWNRG